MTIPIAYISMRNSFGYPAKAVFAGGSTASSTYTDVVDYVNVATTGNATSFGTLNYAKDSAAGLSNNNYGVISGGFNTTNQSLILSRNELLVFSTNTVSTTVGNMNALRYGCSSCSNSTYGLFAGGYVYGSGSPTNTIEYLTIPNISSSSSFGTLATAKANLSSGCGSSTRGLFPGGYTGSTYAGIEYVTISTSGTGTFFGNLTTNRDNVVSASNSTRAVMGGVVSTNTVTEYVTIATTGNATNFGALSVYRYPAAASTNATRVLFAGGVVSTTYYTTIDYVNIATTANATNFGALTTARHRAAAVSSYHGGIQ